MKFSLLHHFGWAGRDDHFDLLLQTESGIDDNDTVLKTFSTRNNVCPSGIMTEESGAGIHLELRPNHRRFYLHYEGPISNERGFIRRIDTGTLIWVSEVFEQGEVELTFELIGKCLNGCFLIRQDISDQWVMVKVARFQSSNCTRAIDVV